MLTGGSSAVKHGLAEIVSIPAGKRLCAPFLKLGSKGLGSLCCRLPWPWQQAFAVLRPVLCESLHAPQPGSAVCTPANTAQQTPQ